MLKLKYLAVILYLINVYDQKISFLKSLRQMYTIDPLQNIIQYIRREKITSDCQKYFGKTK